jgi:hypothetical protein
MSLGRRTCAPPSPVSPQAGAWRAGAKAVHGVHVRDD